MKTAILILSIISCTLGYNLTIISCSNTSPTEIITKTKRYTIQPGDMIVIDIDSNSRFLARYHDGFRWIYKHYTANMKSINICLTH